MNVRDTANIDVVNRPRSKLLHETLPDNKPEVKEAKSPPVYSSAVQRDFTVGTLKRGRKVIRLQTTRLPSPESIAKPKVSAPLPIISPTVIREEQEEASPRRPAPRPYGGADRTALPVSSPLAGRRNNKTPGEKMKEKYMVFSRKGPKKESVVGLHKRLLASAIPVAANLDQPVIPVLAASKDSGLGSSPIVTAPTSFRTAKQSETPQQSSRLHPSIFPADYYRRIPSILLFIISVSL